MPRFRINKIVRFETAHSLGRGYEGNCSSIHGHSYKAEIGITGDVLNDQGILIDFKVLKNILYPVIEELDHAILIDYTDRDQDEFEEYLSKRGQKICGIAGNPTAETICLFLAEKIQNGIAQYSDGFDPDVRRRGIRLDKIKLFETNDSFVEWFHE